MHIINQRNIAILRLYLCYNVPDVYKLRCFDSNNRDSKIHTITPRPIIDIIVVKQTTGPS